ncbi:MAG: hypothetical protein J6Y27_05065 [Bacteroidales bacterium]|nr:hypothetical protein [Bacteroidales bacterium]
MKRFGFILLLMATLALSCTREALPGHDPSETGFKTIHYKVLVSSFDDTKATTADNNTKYVFQATDSLYVSSTDPGTGDVQLFGVLKLIYGSGETTAYFEGDLVGVNEFEPASDTPIDVTLVSDGDRIHTTGGGKLTGTAYPSNEYATSLADAVQKFSHFTCSTTFGATMFTLTQQSAFLVFTVKFDATEVPVTTNVTAKVFNNSEVDPIWTSVVSAAALGSSFSQVKFVIALPGDNISLTDAKLSVQWGEVTPVVFDDVTNASLASNSYYTISRTTLPAYDGFRIRATVANTTVTFNANYADNIEYSEDGGYNWTRGTTPCTLVNVDDEICVRGNRANYKNDSGDQYGTPGGNPLFTTSSNNKVFIAGNIMSLLDNKDYLVESAFQGTFSKGSGNGNRVTYIDIAENDPLILPVTTLADKCYMQMFRNCTSLTHAPTFTVNTAAFRCCYNMFRDCSGLSDVSTISLPAVTMYVDCYREMFRLCSSLTSVDSELLPATTLATSCYQQMFQSSGITTAPNLPATALVASCYSEMFRYCASLNYIKCLAQNGINSSNSTSNWVGDVSESGTFVKYSGVSWPTNGNGIPSGWTVQEATN